MSSSKWRPSKGGYGIFGSYGGSKYGQRRRGELPDAADQSLIDEAKNKLDTLQVEYDRLTGGESIFDTLKRSQADDATMTADEGMEDIAMQESAGGFSGGTGGNPRGKLLKRLRNTVKSITAEKDEEETSAINRIRGNMQEILLGVKGAIKDADNSFDVDEYLNFKVPGSNSSGFEDTTGG